MEWDGKHAFENTLSMYHGAPHDYDAKSFVYWQTGSGVLYVPERVSSSNQRKR